MIPNVLFLLQGDRGGHGPPGYPGVKGQGYPGPQVIATILKMSTTTTTTTNSTITNTIPSAIGNYFN